MLSIDEGEPLEYLVVLNNLWEYRWDNVEEYSDGYHIFRLAEHRARGRFTFEETKEDIRELIRRERLEEGYAKWIDDLKSEAYIEIKGG